MDSADPPAAGPLARTARNAGWLLGGKSVGAVLSIVYLGLAARTLGLEEFGRFALILTFGQALANLTAFQSWQVVVHYGARWLADGSADRLRQLVGFALALDAGAATVGALAAAAGALALGPLLGWSDDTAQLAVWFALAQLLQLRGAATGLLRLFDRFDLAAYAETVLPAMRFVGALAVWAAGPSVAGFLLAWAVAELVTTVAIALAARRELRTRNLWAGGRPALAGAAAANPGLWRFAWTTNFAQSLNLVWTQLPVLAVGALAGAGPAGLYRIAAQVAGALAKPSQMLTRAIFPEFARQAAAGDPAFGPTLRRAALLATVGGVAMTAFAALAGGPALALIFGSPFAAAAPILTLLTLSTAIQLAGFAFEPALVALGRPGWALAARAAGAALLIATTLILLDRLGPIGAAWGTVAGSLAAAMLLAWALRGATDRPRRGLAAIDAEAPSE